MTKQIRRKQKRPQWEDITLKIFGGMLSVLYWIMIINALIYSVSNMRDVKTYEDIQRMTFWALVSIFICIKVDISLVWNIITK